MQVEFADVQRNVDFEGVLICYLMECGFNNAIVTASVEYAEDHVFPTGAMCVLVTEESIDPEEREKFRQYSAIKQGDAIVWSFNCVQILAKYEDLTETILEPSMRAFADLRITLEPYGKQTRTHSKDKISQVVDAIISRMMDNARTHILTAADEVRMLETAIRMHTSQIRSLHQELESVKQRAESQRKLFNSDEEWQEASLRKTASEKINELKALYESGAVTHFEVKPNEFLATTHEVSIEYPDDSGIMWSMGRFIICIPWSGGSVSIRQPDTMMSEIKKPHDESHPHPHISGSSPCWGQWAGAKIRELLEAGEYAQIVTLTLQWLENYNPGSPYAALPCSMIRVGDKTYYSPLSGYWYDPRLKKLLEENDIDIETWRPGMKVGEMTSV